MRHFTFFSGYKIFEIWWYPSLIVRLDGNLPHPKGWGARAASGPWIGERSSLLDCQVLMWCMLGHGKNPIQVGHGYAYFYS